jgi:hypothetical protein
MNDAFDDEEFFIEFFGHNGWMDGWCGRAKLSIGLS